MRAFFGLSPDTKVKDEIATWRNTEFPDLAAPVAADNFHVTLAFIGQITSHQVNQLTALIDVMPRHNTFDVALNQQGYWAKPKAFWLGCQKTSPEHLRLVNNIKLIAEQAGLSLQEQPYIAHLTLSRKCKEPPSAGIVAANFKWRAEQFHLFESVSSQDGVRYIIRHSWPLYTLPS